MLTPIGRLVPATALAVAQAHLAGRIVPESFRGRSCYPPAVQAAQHFARVSRGVDAVDSLPPVAVDVRPDRSVVVRLAERDAELRVVVEPRETAPIARLTCGAESATPVVVWELRSMTDEAE